MSILEAIADGATRVSEIGNAIGRDASGISRYLQNLSKLTLVERETPVTDPDGRGVYRIADEFLRFWFRFVSPNRGTLEQGRTEPVRDAIDESFATHTSDTFETVCQQVVQSAAFPVDCARVGRWWYDGEEIDVVGVNPRTETLLLGECKWTNTPVDRGLLSDLESLASAVRWRGADRSVAYALFSRSGFTADLKTEAEDRSDLFVYTPADLAAVLEM